FDPIPQISKNSNDEGNGEEDIRLNVGGEEGHIEEEEEDELYRDVNINQGRGLQTTLDVEDSHVTLTPTPTSVAPLPMTAPTITPSTIDTITTTSQEQILPTTVLSNIIQNLPNFGSLFCFDDRLRLLEANFSKFTQANQFAREVSAIPGIVQLYMDQRMNEAVKVAVQIQSDHLRDEAQRENDEFLKSVETCRRSSRSRSKNNSRMKNPPLDQTGGQRDAEKERSLKEPMQTTCQMEEPSHPEFDTCAKDQPIVQSSQHLKWFSQQQKPPTPDRDWNKTVSATHGSIHPWISELAKRSDSRSSFNELMDTPLDFFNFLINRLKVDTLTPKL
nr:hypothetical protein [Tanacetum cinerariifolium]